jgi:hypothetical protein
MQRFLWRLRATFHLWRLQMSPADAWHYSSALSDDGPCCYFRECYSPRAAVLEDASYWEN